MIYVTRIYEDDAAWGREDDSNVLAYEVEDEKQIDVNSGIRGKLKLCLGKFPNNTFVVPNGIESIGHWAFAMPEWDVFDCTIKKIVIPESVQKIEGGAFEFTHIKEVEIHPNSPCGVVKDGAVYSKDLKRLIWILKVDKKGEFVVPDGVECISESPFDYDFEGIELKSIVIPASVKRIEEKFDCEYTYNDVLIKAPKGSYAIEFAKERRYKYEEI